MGGLDDRWTAWVCTERGGSFQVVPARPSSEPNSPAVPERQANAAAQAGVRLGEKAHLSSLGTRIRTLRGELQLTLQAVADRTGLSPSMISMIERAQTSPSIGTLVAISSALGVRVGDLFDFEHGPRLEPVLRHQDQDKVTTPTGVEHRAAVVALAQGLGVNINEYAVGAASAEDQLHHTGFECGVVLEGTLLVEVGDESYVLGPGDSIAYDSALPHRISNAGEVHCRAVWVNLNR